MKAMILAAGLGTRLAPFTDHTPKPLFTIAGRPLLELTIERLRQAGCSAVMINTHHLHQRIEHFVAGRDFGIPVATRHEPEILGTGGGIRNIADWWRDDPLLVVNADIVCDIDPAAVIAYHRGHGHPVTMVMHDYIRFNTVWVDENEVRSFETGPLEHARRLAFTGIHVLDRRVLDFIPPKGFAGIIDAYRHLLAAGHRIRAYVARNHYWRDIGTPESYQDAVFEAMAAPAFAKAFGRHSTLPVERRVLHGDGSDRRWYRLVQGEDHLILADHHIRSGLARQEVDAYVDIGRHLHARDVPVPRIYAHDNFSGLVFVEDLGDTHFQSLVADQSAAVQRGLYRRVIDLWIEMGIEGAKGFDTAWTYQTTHYDRRLILDREARYFTDAFLRNYLQRTERYEEFADEFERLADAVFDHAVMGFMHRDMQSRNIMARGDAIFFLDFQAGRIGPVQYDLAALLIDPYVGLSYDLQEELHDYAAQTLSQRHGIDPDRFKKGYSLCRITRNLQILGAFAFLSRVKGKTAFETYIPAALKNLRYFVHQASSVALPKLAALVDALLAERGR